MNHANDNVNENGASEQDASAVDASISLAALTDLMARRFVARLMVAANDNTPLSPSIEGLPSDSASS